MQNLTGLSIVFRRTFFNSPDCSDILFLNGLEKSDGEKDTAESRFPAPNNFIVKNFHLPTFSLFLHIRRKKNYGKARRCFQESDFSR